MAPSESQSEDVCLSCFLAVAQISLTWEETVAFLPIQVHIEPRNMGIYYKNVIPVPIVFQHFNSKYFLSITFSFYIASLNVGHLGHDAHWEPTMMCKNS